jgi:hypothetical protein
MRQLRVIGPALLIFLFLFSVEVALQELSVLLQRRVLREEEQYAAQSPDSRTQWRQRVELPAPSKRSSKLQD